MSILSPAQKFQLARKIPVTSHLVDSPVVTPYYCFGKLLNIL